MTEVTSTTSARRVPRARRPLVLCLLLALTMAACAPQDDEPDDTVEEEPPEATVEGRDLFVAPDGSDDGPGSEDEPFGTLTHGVAQLEPGDTLHVRGGTYEERVIDMAMPDSSASAPTRILAYPGEMPVVRGLFWLVGGSHWIVDGINVSWDPDTGRPDEHMVKVTNGKDWVFRNAELSDAESFAAMLVAGTQPGEPSRWQVTGNCLRDTFPANATNQDHNLYVNTGIESGPGLIEGNVFVGAVNGQNIKLGPEATEGGVADVEVRYNTMYDAAQNLLISGESRNILIERNILGRTGEGYGTIRGYELTGTNNVARHNIGFDADVMILNRDGGNGVTDGGSNHFDVDPGFEQTVGCDDLVPTNDEVAGYGHTAAGKHAWGSALGADLVTRVGDVDGRPSLQLLSAR
jgi:hypothetical protein